MRKLIVGNWKMNGSLAMNTELLGGVRSGLSGISCDLAVCVPFPYLAQCQSLLEETAVVLGAQDVSSHAVGAYTGQVSTRMLLDFGCRYAIVGHSERREFCGETDEVVADKVQRALAGGLTPILCVGETLEEKEDGRTQEIVGNQINAVLKVLEDREVSGIVVAYEPIWAIGTGKTPTPEMAEEVHAMIRNLLVSRNAEAGSRVRILYGGSMKPSNAAGFLEMPDIDGGLIGGAALKAQDFLAIAKLASI
ncbi:MAG: triose-phosphate isomerase [Oxalobacter sp.]|nr:triose-phosphate isomerase [Oxalobacter sp.]